MNYENLKDAIIAVIKQNGNEEITGNILQQVLVAMVNSLGSGYQFRGIATPETNPGTPDQRVFYLASATGTYLDFGVIVSDEICALVYDTAWHKQTIVALDQEPTEDSGNLISSGAIYTALQNLADVYMKLVEDADEDHIATFGANGQVKDSGLSLDDIAKAKGSFPELFAGFAGNLVDTRSAGTRQGPFSFRQSGGDGVNYMRKILGRTEAFNQLIKKTDLIATMTDSSGVTITNNGDGSFTITGVASRGTYIQIINNAVDAAVIGHKALAICKGIKFYFNALSTQYTDAGIAVVEGNNNYRLVLRIDSGTTYNVTFYPQIFDLTQMFGAGNEPSTVAEFRALHPLGYYNYNAGVLKNNAATGLETTGSNRWDEEWLPGTRSSIDGETYAAQSGFLCSKNKIPVIGGQTYYIKVPGNAAYRYFFYDGNGVFMSTDTALGNATLAIPTGVCFINFQLAYSGTYANDICINLSDASRNGEYEPYWKRDIVLGLDNLACHDENNNAVVVNGLDGVGTSQDELVVENGWGTKINKKRVRVDLGGLNWTYVSAPIEKFYTDIDATFKDVASNAKANLLCQKYETNTNDAIADKQIASYSQRIYVKDSAYTDAATFKAAMSGVYADVELATPKVLTLDNPIPALIEVDNLGTERRLPEDTADNPQGPFECDSNYSISTANLVRKLSEL